MRILVACENLQELEDLRLLAQDLKQKTAAEVYFFALPLLYGASESAQFEGFDKLIYPLGSRRGNVKFLPLAHKIYLGLMNALYLISLFYRHKIDLCLTGVPLMYTKIARVLSYKTLFVAYVRSLLADDEHPTSSSEKIWYRLKLMPGHQLFAALAPYQADYVLTIGERNKKTLVKKGLKPEQIFITGPLAVDQIKVLAQRDLEGNEIVFLMQAFNWHNDQASAQAQHAFLLELVDRVRSHKGLWLRIRPHPRDLASLDSSLFQENILLDTSGTDFLQTLTDRSLVVSAVSTLNFEADYLGFAHCFFAMGAIQKRFASWYDSLAIQPLGSVDEVIALAKKLPAVNRDLRNYDEVMAKTFRGQTLEVTTERIISLMKPGL